MDEYTIHTQYMNSIHIKINSISTFQANCFVSTQQMLSLLSELNFVIIDFLFFSLFLVWYKWIQRTGAIYDLYECITATKRKLSWTFILLKILRIEKRGGEEASPLINSNIFFYYAYFDLSM